MSLHRCSYSRNAILNRNFFVFRNAGSYSSSVFISFAFTCLDLSCFTNISLKCYGGGGVRNKSKSVWIQTYFVSLCIRFDAFYTCFRNKCIEQNKYLTTNGFWKKKFVTQKLDTYETTFTAFKKIKRIHFINEFLFFFLERTVGWKCYPFKKFT